MARQPERRKILLLVVGVSILAATTILYFNERAAPGNQTLVTRTTEPVLKAAYTQRAEYQNPLLLNVSGQCPAVLGEGLLVTNVPATAALQEGSEALMYTANGLVAERLLKVERVDCAQTACGASGRALWVIAESAALEGPCRIGYRLLFSE